tara:strand:+ start:47360 stop:47899 length:540 start_codon:yes stop_codon:yes gene_type:complete
MPRSPNKTRRLVIIPVADTKMYSSAKGIRMPVHYLRSPDEVVEEIIVNNGGEKIPGYVDALTQSELRIQKNYAKNMVKYIKYDIGSEELYYNILNYAKKKSIIDSSFVSRTINNFIKSNNKTLRDIGNEMQTMWDNKLHMVHINNLWGESRMLEGKGGAKKQKRKTKKKRKSKTQKRER